MSPAYDDIRKLIERRFRRRMFFSSHLIFFMAAVIVTSWWILTHEVYYPDWQNLWYLAGWAVIFFLHALFYRLSNARDREIERSWALYGEKHKHETSDYPAYLSDQLQEVDWDETEMLSEKPKRRG